MKRITNKALNYRTIISSVILLSLFSCNDFLDREPLSAISPETFFYAENDLAYYLNRYYHEILPSHTNNPYGDFVTNYLGAYGIDRNTDNQALFDEVDAKWRPGEWKVPQNSGNWNFGMLYNINYFLGQAIPRWEKGEISGNQNNIKHYIGEMYFLRAYHYFTRLQEFGDYPIIRNVLPDEWEPLVEASKRAPRTEVARFIIEDLDKAISMLMVVDPNGGRKNRISRACAYLLKSRVGLYEGTWLKYFKGTAYVPNGEGWPGKAKDYNANFQFPTGSIDNEINYFLEQSINAARVIADSIPLTVNTGIMPTTFADRENTNLNPYLFMWGVTNMSGYPEILLWREYNRGLNLVNSTVMMTKRGNGGNGLTKGLVECFLMDNGLPIYAPGSGYAGDDYIADVRRNRDGRLWLFLKEPGQPLTFQDDGRISSEPNPLITGTTSSTGYNTGYAICKGIDYTQKHDGEFISWSASPAFRSSEANMNYIEAYYERYGTLDERADRYWTAIRTRARMDVDYMKTINATDMVIEAKGDWGAYSGGTVITDKFLYNIRRERRCELMAGDLRWMDLKRWRSLDQICTTPYHVEGMKIWGPMQAWYSDLTYGLNTSAGNNISSPELSQYVRPYQKRTNQIGYDGWIWHMAHYLSPIPYNQFQITSAGGGAGEISTSPIYQNPGWPIVANGVPIGL